MVEELWVWGLLLFLAHPKAEGGVSHGAYLTHLSSSIATCLLGDLNEWPSIALRCRAVEFLCS